MKSNNVTGYDKHYKSRFIHMMDKIIGGVDAKDVVFIKFPWCKECLVRSMCLSVTENNNVASQAYRYKVVISKPCKQALSIFSI